MNENTTMWVGQDLNLSGRVCDDENLGENLPSENGLMEAAGIFLRPRI